jgi:hypothetical protein
MSTPRPLCFVLMPRGVHSTGAGEPIDFDAVYGDVVRPAIEHAGLEPVRGNDDLADGVIGTPTLERLALCEYLVADLTTAAANILHELGVRRAGRRHVTVLLFAEGHGLPFDATALRPVAYRIEHGKPSDVDATRLSITRQLEVPGTYDGEAGTIAELLNWPMMPEVAHESTDVFRDRAEYSHERKRQLADARASGPGAREKLRAIEASLGTLSDTEVGVVVDLFLSYRAVKAWDDMIRLVEAMDAPLGRTVLVREQLAFALNRAGRGEQAERILLELLAERGGGTSETYALLGRVYKDRWEAAATSGGGATADAMLQKAIDTYTRGFETDSRDALPGINAVTLMELRDPPDPRRTSLTPVVRFAVERKMAAGAPDYWDHATLIELAVLAKDEGAAGDALRAALANVREVWEPETTARNLRLIREARERRGERLPWAARIEESLATAAVGGRSR